MEFYKTPEQRNGVQLILQTIKDYGPLSKREIQEKTELSWGHISQVTKRFLAEGYIVVNEKEMTAGRSRELLDINGRNNYFIGIDFNHNRIRAVLTDMKGRVIEGVRYGWDVYERDVVLDTIYNVLDDLIQRYQDKTIKGMCFAVQGVVDVSNGVSRRIDKIKDWRDIPLKELMENRYGIETVVAHDPDCLMKYEYYFGTLKNRGVKEVVLIDYSYGLAIGMSIMINGQIYIGHQGIAGEIGYMLLNEQKDGKERLLEQYAGKKDDEIDMNQLIQYLGRSIASVNSLFNPEVLVMHMQESDYQQEIVDMVKEYLEKYSYNKDVELHISRMNKNAKALGAAVILFDREIDRVV